MNREVRDLLWDINFAVHGKPTRQPIGPTSYSTHPPGDERPDVFRVFRGGRWFEVTARVLTTFDAP